jgi:XTP/dITP diphosphohydrolase
VRDLLVATTNRGKVREYEELLAGAPVRLVSLDDLPSRPAEPAEDADTYVENAIAKAREYARASGLLTVADDSGLEVDALGGAPGVRTKRYFGDDATDAVRNERLLALLRGRADRGARFVAVIALAWPDGRVETFEGESRGRIAERPAGAHGFGYDPVFVPDGERATMAELGPAVKHAISHRGRAAAKLRERLARLR